MNLKITPEDVWAASMVDQPGALAAKLDALSGAGANLAFVIARRAHEQPNTGVVFVTPIIGAQQIQAAQQAGFEKTQSLQSVCIETTDKPGLAAALTNDLAAAGINLHGFSAAAIGEKCVLHLAFDSTVDAENAIQRLGKI